MTDSRRPDFISVCIALAMLGVLGVILIMGYGRVQVEEAKARCEMACSPRAAKLIGVDVFAKGSCFCATETGGWEPMEVRRDPK